STAVPQPSCQRILFPSNCGGECSGTSPSIRGSTPPSVIPRQLKRSSERSTSTGNPHLPAFVSGLDCGEGEPERFHALGKRNVGRALLGDRRRNVVELGDEWVYAPVDSLAAHVPHRAGE